MQYGFGYFEEDKLGEVTDLNLWRRILGYAVNYWQGVALAVFLSFCPTWSGWGWTTIS